ncbi:hypothetical protein ACXXHR_08505 [Staphylococcus epidermidis]|uniref:hypothetical protein n=2 Tax=Staphylococcus TaxID=1279 RepID=UPI0018897828|nr:hypothetical protein [Staphylococcus epidermidis]MBF2236400.1 hypothetical protein [Staphylococcus epidermidis]MBF2253234.1 hypothetical protein [Staphylococcus epidermidis]MBF2253304.1 hypothetical protein [Staphylococcus epidermidis]MBM0825989.1 hypothetical protein [Staphylococcus epidermidis]MCG1085234.1 hypothetical protein [Staphylococcus epidermidis]
MKHKLLKIANDLNVLIVHTKENVECSFKTGICEDEVVLFFHHYSDEYDAEVKDILFAEFHTPEKLYNKFELAKKVIKGECLIDERNSDISN